jgi:CheY-like chemotaxis protein
MPKILVVDDSAVDRQLFEGLLSKVDGFTVVHAGNGKQALEKIREWQIDLVITDLQMPELDGLELVKTMRSEFPGIPVILVTGVGSEEVATQALHAGAASYVPKSKTAELLVPTVQNLIAIMHEGYSLERLLRKAIETRFEFVLNNDEAYTSAIIELCLKMLEGMSPLDQLERLRVGVAIEHAMSNALYRGNLQLDPRLQVHGNKRESREFVALIRERMAKFKDRTIYVCLDIKPDEFECVIRDQGPGFEPDDHATIEGAAGRGLILMQAFMDEVEFDLTGNEVTLRKIWNRKPAAASKPAPAKEITVDDLLELGSINLGVFNCAETGMAIEMIDPKQLVGREATCHIVLNDKAVDRHHCQLTYRNGLWSFEAMKGCPMFINGEPVTRGTIMPGDKVRIGSREYQIDYEAAV